MEMESFPGDGVLDVKKLLVVCCYVFIALSSDTTFSHYSQPTPQLLSYCKYIGISAYNVIRMIRNVSGEGEF